MQAAIEGVIDFSTARPKEKSWWSRYHLLIDAMRHKQNYRINLAAFEFHLGVLGNSRLETKSFEENLAEAKKRFIGIVGALRPWEGADFEERAQKDISNDRQRYIDIVGVDPLDPKFKEWEAEQIKRFLAQGQGQETDEQRVLRKIKEAQ